MREPNPDRMMAGITARQFNEWMAYEHAFGPLDDLWTKEALAQINELIQFNNQLTGAAVTGKGKKNPAGKFHRVERPWRYGEEPEPEDDEDEDDDVIGQMSRFDREVFGEPKAQDEGK